MGGGVYWEGGVIWLWCEWERGLKEGLWEKLEGQVKVEQGMRNGDG